MIDWKEYEVRKKKLTKNLTSAQYESAIKKIVKELEQKETRKGKKK